MAGSRTTSCQHRVDAGPPGATPLDRAQSGGKFVEVEGLAEIVVGTGVEPGNPVADLVARREQQDRRGVAFAPSLRQQVDPGPVRQHDVEDDRLVVARAQGGIGIGTGRNRIRTEAGELQPDAQSVEQHGVVLDDENAHRWQRLLPLQRRLGPPA